MNGRVFQRRRGKGLPWSYVVDAGRDQSGRRKQRMKGGFRTKADAERALRELLHSLDTASYVEPSKRGVGQYLVEEWLPAIRSTVKPTTFDQYRMLIVAHVQPRIGDIGLQALTPAHLNALYGELVSSGRKDGQGGLSTKTVRHVHTTLRKALGDAVRWGRLARNPASLADPPRVLAPELKVWDSAQMRKFLASVRDDRLYAAWLLLATTGVRRGELLGLRWEDLDLERAKLSVRRAVTVVRGEPVATEPKTAKGRRTLSLDPATLAALCAHLQRQREERIAAGPAWQEFGLVFCRADGSAFNPEAVSRHFMHRVAAVGLPNIGIHGLRHSYATAALAAGVSAKVVSERLGHASVAITLDVYSHVLPAHDEEAASKVAAHILGH